MAVFRTGRFIGFVPKVVVSGFMNGIAVLIWLDQIEKLFGIAGKNPFGGSLAANFAIAIGTLAVVFLAPGILRRLVPRVSDFFPATLIAIVAMTLVTRLGHVDVETVELSVSLASPSDLMDILRSQTPTEWSWPLVGMALPFALQLAMLGYLDTLLTSLVVDKLSGETTRQNKELAAHGLANGMVAFVGGIPGAQATIRSVLMIKERATLRLAGIMVGVFVLVEMIVFQNLIGWIPEAVFAGILLKVGYDVFDWQPVSIYVRDRLRAEARPIADTSAFRVSHLEMLFIAGTTSVTIFWDLNTAVILFVALFYLVRRVTPLHDLSPVETAAILGED